MVSSVEMVLWAIHHATTLLFGVFASAALCGIEINRVMRLNWCWSVP